MSPREKKPPIKPDKRQEWLARCEGGESPPKIAAADGVDPRTVRKHIEIAKQEKERKEARASVLRSALERHYADLCRYAEGLGGQFSAGHFTESDHSVTPAVQYELQLATALRQHIPRSPIWGLLNQQTKLRASEVQLTKEIERRIEESVASDPHLLTALTGEENGVIPGLIAALSAQAQQWIQGWFSLNVEDNLKAKPAESGFVDLSYGAYNMGVVKEEHVELVRTVILDWTVRIKEWDVFHGLEKDLRDLGRVEKNLRDEIAVIALRRVVPGRCRYCPL